MRDFDFVGDIAVVWGLCAPRQGYPMADKVKRLHSIVNADKIIA